jgi:hypothetical protein
MFNTKSKSYVISNTVRKSIYASKDVDRTSTDPRTTLMCGSGIEFYHTVSHTKSTAKVSAPLSVMIVDDEYKLESVMEQKKRLQNQN